MRTIRYRREITAPPQVLDQPSLQIRLAAVLFLAPATGFGLSTPFVLGHLAREGALPTIIGIRALSGPFEAQLGRDAFTALGWALVASCALDALTGLWLWQGRRRGVLLGLGSTPLSLALGFGFALPALLVAVPTRAGLILATSRNSRGGDGDAGGLGSVEQSVKEARNQGKGLRREKATMVSEGLRTWSIRDKIGWWVLVGIAGASVANHISAPFLGFASGDDEMLAFLGMAAMNIYALVVLLTVYRRSERWAWWITWVFVAMYAAVILYAPVVGPYYLGAAIVMAFIQLMTWSGFRQP
jgi:hypothetical protein